LPRLTFALLLLAAPLAAAEPDLAVEGTLVAPVPIGFLSLAPETGTPGFVGSQCRTDMYRPHPETRSFSFRETEQESGCLGVRYNLTLPSTVRSFELAFRANRTIRQESITGPANPTMVQSVWLLADGSRHQDYPVFDPSEPSHPMTEYSRSFDVPAAKTLQIEWRFADQGSQGLPSLAAFSATVQEPLIRVPRIPIPADIRSEPGHLDGSRRYVAQYRVDFEVPDDYRAAASAGQFEMRLEIRDSALEVIRIDGPSGVLEASEYEGVFAGGTRTVTLPRDTLRLHGGGPYTIHLRAPDVLQENAAFQVVSYIALSAPAIAFAVAWFGVRRTELDDRGEA
jgi:hypothetical protein